MKELGGYLAKYLKTFLGFVGLLFLLNLLVLALFMSKVVREEYARTATPIKMLALSSQALEQGKLSGKVKRVLKQNNIWLMVLDEKGKRIYAYDLPEGIPSSYTVQEVAVFSKGYLHDYPVFVQSIDQGLLVLGYPIHSFFKFTSNYLPTPVIYSFPIWILVLLGLDLFLLFIVYSLSKQKIVKNTKPILDGIGELAHGKPVALETKGDLLPIAQQLNQASEHMAKQNEARANWIRGVSHDIRTPLSMIMGYAQRIEKSQASMDSIKKEAKIITNQSQRIKDLIEDLNIASRLEYDAQPLPVKKERIAKLVRQYVIDLMNMGMDWPYSIEVNISAQAESAELNCDARLIERAIHNLTTNSMLHNKQGCTIFLDVYIENQTLILKAADDGIGFSKEQLDQFRSQMNEDPYQKRHGLGLRLVEQIVHVHHGKMILKNRSPSGAEILLIFPQ